LRSISICGYKTLARKFGQEADIAKREIKIKEYKDAKEFDKDAEKMVKDGWNIQQQSQGSTHMNVGRTMTTTLLTGGLNLLTPKIGGASYSKGKIMVTWLREK
jgi:hypothetical protein